MGNYCDTNQIVFGFILPKFRHNEIGGNNSFEDIVENSWYQYIETSKNPILSDKKNLIQAYVGHESHACRYHCCRTKPNEFITYVGVNLISRFKCIKKSGSFEATCEIKFPEGIREAIIDYWIFLNKILKHLKNTNKSENKSDDKKEKEKEKDEDEDEDDEHDEHDEHDEDEEEEDEEHEDEEGLTQAEVSPEEIKLWRREGLKELKNPQIIQTMHDN